MMITVRVEVKRKGHAEYKLLDQATFGDWFDASALANTAVKAVEKNPDYEDGKILIWINNNN